MPLFVYFVLVFCMNVYDYFDIVRILFFSVKFFLKKKCMIRQLASKRHALKHICLLRWH